ncbi:MAG: prepilin-type N-terminal cleavage/methylation domain-containing protein [Magnetococcales bacterium]|nr:prepilin-type N-terminal cleavage/methylation domain-containing protein [Magnetococcales bacterium]
MLVLSTVFYRLKMARLRPGANGSGFSLIELILVLLLASIVTVAVAPRWPGSGLVLQQDGDQLAGDLNLARASAMSYRDSMTLQRSASVDRYSLTDSSGAIRLTSRSLGGSTFSAFTVTFDEKGNPGRSDLTITLSSRGDQRTLTVVGESGAVLW